MWLVQHDSALLIDEMCSAESGGIGCMVFHRSGDVGVGAHGNSGLWRNSDSSHRIALVLYQTDFKASSGPDPLPVHAASSSV